jgi:PKD repeat protein
LNKKIVPEMMLTLLLISMLTLAFNIEQASAVDSPYIAVVPDTIVDPTMTPGKNFTVSIYTNYAGSDICGWQFTLTYNPSIIQGVSVTNGDLITNATFPPFPPPPARFKAGEFDNTLGKLSLTVAYFDLVPTPTVSGPGTLANVTFLVVGLGCSDIILGPETKLKGLEPISVHPCYIVRDYLRHGYFCNIPLIHLETDKDVYILGENVTITLENIGTETVSIGGYPAWGIYTYPEEALVYPKVYAFLAWSLEPGENDTFIWNQYNAFTNSLVDPGMYVVCDTQGWGLSAYFTIVAGNLPPIANFTYSPTFPYVGQTVTFDASDSSDSDGTIVSYAWDFGDGLMGTGVITPHTYESAGTFTVTLTVTDDLGATDTLQQEITVDPLPTLTITINKIKKGTTETILLELVDDDYDVFITQNVDKRLRGIIRRTHKTTTFDFPGTYSATKGALNVTLQSRNDFIITLS